MSQHQELELEEMLSAFDSTLPVEEASTIPASWYVDERIAKLETTSVFGRTWQLIGSVDQVAEPGQYVTGEVAGAPIVVVRGHDHVLRGFYNVCRHHAAQVMQDCGRAERLRCPYHGWTYGLDGQLKSVSELDGIKRFHLEQYGLRPVSVGIWENLVFVNRDPRAPSLEEWVGERLKGIVEPLAIAGLKRVARHEWTLACNWKVFIDNYLDGGYHVPFLHHDLGARISFKEYAIDCFDRACVQSSPVRSEDELRKGKATYVWLYPNLMLNIYEGYLDTNFVIPLGVDKTKVVIDFYFSETTSETEQSIALGKRIQDEDHAICESVQRGLASGVYDTGRLAPRREAGENLFHKLLAADLKRK